MPQRERRLPIKVVLPQEQDLRHVPSGGSARKVFDEGAERSVRDQLLQQVSEVRDHFSAVLVSRSHVPAVARVVLKERALAKSHRPRHLFHKDTCPIIGGEMFGELLVSVSAGGLDRLTSDIDKQQAKEVAADISTVSHIEPYSADDAAGLAGVDGLARLVREQQVEELKLRLFRHDNGTLDDRVRLAFIELISEMGLPELEAVPYVAGLRIYRLRGITPDTVARLAGFVGAQSIGIFPKYRLFAQYIPQGSVSADRFPAPEPGRSYPVVGLIDSGTDPDNPLLRVWIVDRDEEDVPRADQCNNHGSFVAGLIINGRHLNHGDHRFPAVHAKIVDVVAVPKPETPVEEADLLRTIRRAVAKYPDVKTWNLSVSRVDVVCRDDAFSDFAMELDAIQRAHDVTFVSCAGNYVDPPLRGWPPEDLGEVDRAFPPADSALCISVGSCAHLDHTSARVRREEPSPFTRRGPGAAFLPKPELCHYGGNCSRTLDYHQMGVVSLDGSGHIAEAIGTSFSTPLVASILANVRHGITEPTSRNLAKALLVQSAALRGGAIVAELLRYRGFGIPGEVDEMLTCAPLQSMLILEPEIPPHHRIFAREDFPIPACFRRPDGRIEGEFLMTLVYDPPLNPAAGAEYCQVNIDLSLGTFDPGPDGKPRHEIKIPLEPEDYARLYERHLVEHGFKWSPVKVYRKRLQRTSGTRWRLMLRAMYRAGVAEAAAQNAALVITLFDPKRQKPVYNDVVTAMARSGWVTQDLQVDERIRARTRG